ncbi:DUF3244 domain-containing protein [Mongoliitalea lutea]|uniref:Por secretion system C-terminal sorting domain-containing protein n=1 Tax=Mongoliitalea lutea TaxID=849756 RepID=A0A8J3CWB6_9BACT|nr:DUF3244 domain-containing protein [Mongoliitalea lutea]GHB29037.1 hypothetical protein GCM10008106_07300 [Mongoliitalea lutea]
MKTILTFALAAVLGTSSFANNSEESISNLTNVQAKEKKVQVTLREGAGKVKVHILDANGKRLFQRNFHVQENILVPFDMTALPCGEYQVAVISKEDPSNQSIHTVTITESTVIELPLMAYVKPLNEDSFKLTVIGLEEPGTQIQIWDESGRKVHSETVNIAAGFSKVYHLRQLKLENLIIQVSDNNGRTKHLQFN